MLNFIIFIMESIWYKLSFWLDKYYSRRLKKYKLERLKELENHSIHAIIIIVVCWFGDRWGIFRHSILFNIRFTRPNIHQCFIYLQPRCTYSFLTEIIYLAAVSLWVETNVDCSRMFCRKTKQNIKWND